MKQLRTKARVIPAEEVAAKLRESWRPNIFATSQTAVGGICSIVGVPMCQPLIS